MGLAAVAGCASPVPQRGGSQAEATYEIEQAEAIVFALPHIRAGEAEAALGYLEPTLDRSALALFRRSQDNMLDPDLLERTRCALHRVQRYRSSQPSIPGSRGAPDAYESAVPESACWPTMEREVRAVRELVRTEVGENDPLYACVLQAHARSLQRLERSVEATRLQREAEAIANPKGLSCQEALDAARSANRVNTNQ